ncbi:hypothetical protein SAMN05443572_103432 [Myxococcus fulvus]|uniref:Uncharacterized protein n=1 Tax=Myxococcus fulvus TaxID=33 RepID=A0ABY1C9X6_MYXFU|nr:hypothetical protein SAMN05443572_103432 [Myxococcus fulvus]
MPGVFRLTPEDSEASANKTLSVPFPRVTGRGKASRGARGIPAGIP